MQSWAKILPIVTSIVVVAGSANAQSIQEVQVWSTGVDGSESTSPTSLLLPADMLAINAATTEDLVKYEPSLVIRRRFIGDSNGTLGLRGSNMFQTSRSMVFADGVPLHYLLQSRWNGAPRWTLVSADEIAQVEVVYGPFSAEYSGNAMGGVVLIETAIPQQREVHLDISGFSQQFDDYGFDDNVRGYKAFASFGDKVGNLSYYLSLNHLENDSQPQTFRGAAPAASVAVDSVAGAQPGVDARDRRQIWYGDTGVVATSTDNLKFKVGYDFGNWQALLNVALEDRTSDTDSANSYVRGLSGETLWSGSGLVQDGQTFSFTSQGLNERFLERQSLSLGLRVKGDLTERTRLELNVSQFDILKDETRSSRLNPNDPGYTSEGRIDAYDDSGWQTAEIKLTQDGFLFNDLELIAGLRHEDYELNLNAYVSPDYLAGIKGETDARFGGKTAIDALFLQANWALSEQWDIAFGIRHERFRSSEGYYSDDNVLTSTLDVVRVPGEKNTKASPKFSVGFRPTDRWLIRYAIAKAYRFPIVEELFRQYQAYNSINEANPELQPENGLHHNLMFDRAIEGGYLRVNLFQETIKDAIESQSTTIVGGPNDGVSVSTFVPLDETRTHGVEFIANQRGMFLSQLDIRFNLTYTRAEITENASNQEWEGNTYPRMPKWRANLLATYHLSERWDISTNLQYAGDSYGRIQNDDRINGVYGAQDAYTRIGLKSDYRLSHNLKISAGVDNLADEVSYVAHPWPGRTLYLGVSCDW